ncbi:MAG TPA: tetratricopeptide repeat protein [Gemmatimonadales bacterium]|nr:tetratricopeptide repeat protein [Gemmatimonadales bacterium]
MGTLSRARLAATALLISWPMVRAAAQQHAGDEAWNQGRFDTARAAYDQVLATDSSAFRANLRLGVMLSWRGKQDSALGYIARARRSEPEDLEARLIEAKVMAWAGRHQDAIARYDSVLSGHPLLVEAELGRARARAWHGDLGLAERGYRTVLAVEPRNADALVGLGYVYRWHGREDLAARMARAALEADSAHAGARELRDAVRATTRASAEVTAGWSNDSDRNTSFWQTAQTRAPLGGGLRVLAGAGALEASDPFRNARRLGGDIGLRWTHGEVELVGAAGGKRLVPDTAAARTAATYRGRVGWRPAPHVSLSAAYAREPFDEIASLMERALDVESLDAGIDAGIARGLSVRGGGGGAWYSDGNHRSHASLGVTGTVRGGFFVGAFGRTLSYARKGIGYFSPDRFRLLEGTAGYELDSGPWDGRLSGGLGAQQIGRRGVAQTVWHVDARLGRRWGIGNRLDLFGSVTNSAVSSTTGAFRYRTAGLIVRLGL